MIRLGDILAVEHLELDLSACIASHDTWVRWVHSAEDIRDVDRLRGGELVVSTGRWRSDASSADRFACALTRHGAAALGLAARPDDDLSDVVSACERWRLPLVEIHPPATCESVSEVATSMIVDRRGSVLNESLERERLFTSSSVSSIQSTLDVLQRGVRHPVLLVTRGGVHLPTGGVSPHLSDLRLLAPACGRSTGMLEIPLSQVGVVPTFAVDRGQEGGTPALARLVCCCPLADLDSRAMALIEQVVLFLGLQLRHMDELRSLHRRGESALVRRILAGEAAADEVEAWVGDLGIESRGEVTCVVVRWSEISGRRGVEFAAPLDDLADVIGAPRVFHQGPDYVGIAVMIGPDAIEEPLRRFKILIGTQLLRGDAHVGTSSTIALSIADVAQTFVQAAQVAHLESVRDPRTRSESEPAAASLAVLMLQSDDDARRSLTEVLLEPLRAYERVHGFDFIETLDVFLRCNGHWKQVAEELGVHVNTVRYRIARVEEVTGRNLSTMQDRVDFYVALRCRDSNIGA